MTDVLVSRLRLRTAPDHAVRTRVRVEDALRLADPDDRLLVCRRLDLGRMPVGATPAQWAERAVARVGELRARAVHATWPNAADRDAVWFHSAEEARALLLRELAAGRTPSAWFWRLAVRDWGGAPLAVWLPRLLGQAASDPVVLVSVARAVAAAAASGRLAGIVAALSHISEPSLPARSVAPEAPSSASFDRPTTLARARRLIAHLDPAAIPAITRVLADGTTPRSTRATIVRLALIAAEPALATQAGLLAALVSALVEDAETVARAKTAEAASPLPRNLDSPIGTPDPPGTEVVGTIPTREAAAARTPPPPAPRADRAGPTLGPRPATPEEPGPPIVAMQERRSRSAGLFLVIRSLILMGFPEWLQARPDLTDARFPRLLLHAIATRMRAPADDPVFAAIGLEQAELSGQPHGDDLTAWRVGLDRWLRRTARIRLVDVATRPGWILSAGEHLRLRYRLDDADIRLRRHALDLDPGWVAWLGQVVHYHYKDEPLA